MGHEIYKIDNYIWYIGKNSKEWFANGIERNFWANTKEELIEKINKWYHDFVLSDDWVPEF